MMSLLHPVYMGSDGDEDAEHRSVCERAWLCLLGSRIVEQGLSNLTARAAR